MSLLSPNGSIVSMHLSGREGSEHWYVGPFADAPTPIIVTRSSRVELEVYVVIPAGFGVAVAAVALTVARDGGASPRPASALGREAKGVGGNENSPETEPSGEVTE